MHNRDFDYKEQIKGKTKAEWEKELGLTGIIVRMENLGWKVMNWCYYTPEELEKYTMLSNFVEYTGAYYTDFLRGDSRDTLKAAFEKVLNEAEKFNQCETRGGHDFTSRKGYNNGMLACKKCGFGGYTNLVEIKEKELKHFKRMYKHTLDRLFKVQTNLQKLGIDLNMFEGIIIKGEYISNPELYEVKLKKS